MKKLSLALSLILAPVALSAEQKVELGLNDVSVLLPFNEQPKLFDVAPNIKGFVDDSILLEINKTLKADEFSPDEQGVSFFVNNGPIFDYRLVSFRIDPCANKIQIGNKLDNCVQEFRLVWQRLDDHKHFADNNIHGIHRITKTEFAEVVKTIRQLKSASGMDTNKLALQPNPVIAKEGVDGAYYQGMLELVKKYARADNLREVAFLAETSQGGHWPMLKLEGQGTSFKAIVLPGTEKDANGKGFLVQRMDGRGVLELPLPLGNAKDNLFQEQDDAKKKFANSIRIDNPSLHSAAETDCASCHRSRLEREQILEETPGLKAPKELFKSAKWNLEMMFPEQNVQSLQVFSYFVLSPRIAQRTINESAVVADFIQANY